MRPCPDSAVPFQVTSGKSQSQRVVMADVPSEVVFLFTFHFRDGEALRSHSNGLRSQTQVVSEPELEIKCPDQYTSYACLCPSSVSLDHRFISPVKWEPMTSASQGHRKDQMQPWKQNGSENMKLGGYQETLGSQEWHRLHSHI